MARIKLVEDPPSDSKFETLYETILSNSERIKPVSQLQNDVRIEFRGQPSLRDGNLF